MLILTSLQINETHTIVILFVFSYIVYQDRTKKLKSGGFLCWDFCGKICYMSKKYVKKTGKRIFWIVLFFVILGFYKRELLSQLNLVTLIVG